MYLDNVIYTSTIDALTMVDPLTRNGVIECKQCTPTKNNNVYLPMDRFISEKKGILKETYTKDYDN